MKANRRFVLEDDKAFTFLIPFTFAIIVTISLLVIGAYVVGEISDTLEATFPTNNATGAGDFRSTNQNKTVNLLGNVTDGFADVVDIEIVVMIITGLSMAIFSIMAIGTRRAAY